ncbi:MAG: hypothetical protein ACRD21_16170 [Vicinamibacteria bacterium]
MASLTFCVLLSLIPFHQASASVSPRFLETVQVVSVRPSEGSVTLAEPGGERRTLLEGDALGEEGGAKLKQVTASTLVFTQRVSGADGEAGEALIVVRFDASGKTRVREYQTVGDVSQPKPPQPEDRYY